MSLKPSDEERIGFCFIKTFDLIFQTARVNDSEVTFQTSRVMTCQ
jgi:hypothetical protein